MNSRIALITVITAALSAGGLMAKQDTGSQHRRGARSGFVNRLSSELNLTAQQKQQARDIFLSARAKAEPIRQQLRAERRGVEMAIQNGKSIGEVQQLAKNEAPMLGDLAANRASAFARFYGVLTPAQQQQLAAMHRQRRQHRPANSAAGQGAAGQNR